MRACINKLAYSSLATVQFFYFSDSKNVFPLISIIPKTGCSALQRCFENDSGQTYFLHAQSECQCLAYSKLNLTYF